MHIRSQIFHQIAGAGLAGTTRLLASTLTFRMHLDDASVDPNSPDCSRRLIIATWHDAMIMPIMLRRTILQRTAGNRMTTLVSKHQDGSFLTYAMRYFYLDTIRGSTNRGGAAALARMIQEIKEQHICITPDGPRGPARVVSPGIVALSSLTGKPVVPTVFTCNRYWRIRGSWTDFLLPMPYSTVFGAIGYPIEVPAALDRDGIELYRGQVQDEMDRLQQEMDRLATGKMKTSDPLPKDRSRAA